MATEEPEFPSYMESIVGTPWRELEPGYGLYTIYRETDG